ncbi:bifunctional UDP-sugar hydrolase/5'-nucleotidase [Bacillus sp. FJAT-50079]|uniref:bifunctional metallophosphatase/5'-nucleotidase n=1 Tax=Bacillus sp. FJAT-50079 TaxID=2833577 RepID=UPI001BC945F9|nr:bifunctional metallophosphatase/5'-nucleotidase [Bacillus sp. FJAT-50079]
MKERIHIYHTNDLHSHFENWPRMFDFIKERQSFHKENGEEVFLFDIGDFADRWHPFTEGAMGKGNVSLLNEGGYTAVTIGNNEGITLPFEQLNDLYDKANFDVIVANLYYKGRVRPDWALPYQIYETRKGTKIGVTAVTAYYQKLYEILGWELSEPITELEMQLNQLKEKVDVIIVLSHLGIYDDEKIAELFPQVDLVLGGHTHHVLYEGKQVKNTTLAAGGKYGRYVGYVTLDVDQDLPTKIEATLYKTADLPKSVNEDEKIAEFREIGKDKLDKEITVIPQALSFDWHYDSDIPTMLCEAIHEWCNADCTMINSGLVLTALKEGRVTKYDLHQMLPHPINPCTVEVSGAELKEILLHSQDEQWPELTVKGLGFRGTVMGKFVYYGIGIDREKHEVKIGGQPLIPTQDYTLGTVDMFTFGKFFPEIRRSEKKHYYMPEFLRDVMEWKLLKLYRGGQ